jgi:hypothetical protein
VRARSIKPGICDNEVLGTADPFYTLLFERLWMIADREGRLEDRPLRIKAQAFPYRDGLDVEPMLAWLAKEGFIVRYEIDGKRYIQVLEFKKHQKPHANEQDSVIPPPKKELGTTKVVPEHNQGSSMDALNPSSLNPDSGLLTPDCVSTREARSDGADFVRIRSRYPAFTGRQDWITAEHHANQRIERDGLTWSDLHAAVERYRAYCDSGGVSGPQFVMTPGKFFSAADRPWMQDWKPPPSKAQVKQDRNISASQQWLVEQEAKDAAH